MWPLLAKELLQLSRRRLCHGLRILPALAFLFLCLDMHPPSSTSGYARYTQELYQLLALVELAALTVLLLWVAPALAEEREQQTLPLLMVTPLTPATIVLAKALARTALLVIPVLTLVGMVAILSITGGIEPVQILRLQGAVLVAWFFGISLALTISSRCRSSVRAIVLLVTWALLLWMVVPPLVLMVVAAITKVRNDFTLLLPFYLPSLLGVVIDPVWYGDLMNGPNWWVVPAGFLLHAVAACALMWIAIRSITNTNLLWQTPSRPRAKRGALSGYWDYIGEPLARWLRDAIRTALARLEQQGVDQPFLARAVLANPYDPRESFGRFVFGITVLPSAGLLFSTLLSDTSTPWPLALALLAVLFLAALVVPVSAVLGCAATGAVIGVAWSTSDAYLLWDVLAAVVVLAMPVLWTIVAIGTSRDRLSGLVDALHVTPLRSSSLAGGMVACGVRAAMPAVAALAAATLTSSLIEWYSHWIRPGRILLTRGLEPAVMACWLAEVVLDLLIGIVAAVAYGLVARRPLRAMTMVVSTYGVTLVASIMTDLWSAKATATFFVATGLLGFLVGMLVKKPAGRTWLTVTGGLWVFGALPALIASFLELPPSRSVGDDWWIWWLLSPTNLLRRRPPFVVLAAHAAFACLAAVWLWRAYDRLAERPKVSRKPRNTPACGQA